MSDTGAAISVADGTRPRIQDVKITGKKRKSKANNDHKMCKDSEHLVNINDSKSLSDVFTQWTINPLLEHTRSTGGEWQKQQECTQTNIQQTRHLSGIQRPQESKPRPRPRTTIKVKAKDSWYQGQGPGPLSRSRPRTYITRSRPRTRGIKAKAKDHCQGQGQGLTSQGQGQGLVVSRPRPRTTVKVKAKDLYHKVKAKDSWYQGQGLTSL